MQESTTAVDIRDLLNDHAEQLSVLRSRLHIVQKSVYEAFQSSQMDIVRQMKLAEAEVESAVLSLCSGFLAAAKNIEANGEEKALLLLMCGY